MSMDKEELLKELKESNAACLIHADAPESLQAMTCVMILRAVIGLVEIRESIDQLRGSINDLGNQLEIRDTCMGKDVRSAGIG